jgi:hypothetical protein
LECPGVVIELDLEKLELDRELERPRSVSSCFFDDTIL